MIAHISRMQIVTTALDSVSQCCSQPCDLVEHILNAQRRSIRGVVLMLPKAKSLAIRSDQPRPSGSIKHHIIRRGGRGKSSRAAKAIDVELSGPLRNRVQSLFIPPYEGPRPLRKGYINSETSSCLILTSIPECEGRGRRGGWERGVCMGLLN